MILAPEDCGCPLEDGASLSSNACSSTLLFMVLLESFVKGRCAIATPCSRVQSVREVDDSYDFIVIGGGTAGSVVAGRLSEDNKYNVLLLEAGGPEPVSARIPSLYVNVMTDPTINWNYRTVPNSKYCLNQGEQGCSWPRGKVLGGCSVLNGMMYVRGHKADFEDWVNAGAEGWSWEENMPYFLKTEGNRQIGSIVSDKFHSSEGPMPIQRFRHQPNAVSAILNALNETGFEIINELNDDRYPTGFTIAQTFNDDGQRVTTARAYLKPKSQRPNLSVKLNAHVTKILIENRRAVGVEYVDESGQKRIVRAKKEVILSAGALNTPHILMLSGIGPRNVLENVGIPVIEDLPVGQNLRNHLGINLYFILENNENRRVLDWAGLTEYLLQQTGPLTSTGVTQVSGFAYSSIADKVREQPDIQMFFNGFYADCSETGAVGEPASECPEDGRSVSATAVVLLPRSVGYISLNSSDPFDSPLFYPEYFTQPEDMVIIKDGARYLQKIYNSPTLQSYGIKLNPSYSACDSVGEAWSDEWIECMVLTYTDPQNHQLGTASIGKVIDTKLKVYNIEGLRVIDASSMPTQPTGNLQGPIMMVAERGAEFIKNYWANA